MLMHGYRVFITLDCNLWERKCKGLQNASGSNKYDSIGSCLHDKILVKERKKNSWVRND